MRIGPHHVRRNAVVLIGIAGIGFFVALNAWWQIGDSPREDDHSSSGSQNPDLPVGSETGSAVFREGPDEKRAAEQEKLAIEIDAQLIELDELLREWELERDRNNVDDPVFSAAQNLYREKIAAFRAPPEAIEYQRTNSADWVKARDAQLCSWRPLIMIELLGNPDSPRAFRDIATALANDTASREKLAEHVRRALGNDVNLDGEGVDGYLDAMRKLEPALREHQKSSLTGPPAARDYLEESAKVFAVNHLVWLYRGPVEAQQNALSKKIGEGYNDISGKLVRLPVGSDARIRLATRLQQLMYPVKK